MISVARQATNNAKTDKEDEKKTEEAGNAGSK